MKGCFIRGKTQNLNLEIDIDGSIVDRAKSIEVATRVVEHIHKGHRKALIVMATGTGKTRVAMAIIDQLIREGRVQKSPVFDGPKAAQKTGL